MGPMRDAREGLGSGARITISVVCVVIGCGLGAPAAFGADSLYWTNSTSISHADLSGLNGGTLQTTAPVSSPDGVVIDAAAGRIYWANDTNNTISYSNLDGSSGGTLNTGSAAVSVPNGLAIDPAAGR